jgi:hypothetical protein
MLVTKTVLGLVPALLRTKVAIIFAMLYFDNAAAMVKPPSNSMMTGVHIAANTYVAAVFESSRLCGFWSERHTRSITARNGTKRDVTKRGMA